MIKRIVEISQYPAHLKVDLDQLRINRECPNPTLAKDASIPCEDIGVIVVEHPEATYTNNALAKLMEFGAVLVVCGRNHLPAGMLLPIPTNTQVVPRVHDQIEASKPLRKQLWRQIVIAKIRGQATNINPSCPAHRRLLTLATEVKSGDSTNTEGQAAKVYWATWLGEGTPFRRNPDGDGINAMLNYGYSILRAALARAIVAAGLVPAVGIHHHNRSDAFALADDLIEPLRPMVDARVRQLYNNGEDQITPKVKQVLLSVLHDTVSIEDQTGPLMVALHRTVASLVECYRGDSDKLLFPLPFLHKV